MSAVVRRHAAPSGNRDADHFYAFCPECMWTGAYNPNRTAEGRRIAARDAEQHRCARDERTSEASA